MKFNGIGEVERLNKIMPRDLLSLFTMVIECQSIIPVIFKNNRKTRVKRNFTFFKLFFGGNCITTMKNDFVSMRTGTDSQKYTK